ncbi:MAG: hypothetical protein OXU23_05350 [Candidatus Poribacteria bacterium]|nr:hypothetical protein [Candidatus Poribacteria bacterium]
MNLQKTVSLSTVYPQGERDFSADLANTLDALNVGKFEDAETEANVGTRKADIVAVGEDGTLVVENQFEKANWDHWGRLEAYARLKEADVAVLVAEEFEELMIVTCNLRNEDSEIDWYLIQVQANTHKELSFHHIVKPAIDIQTEKKVDAGYSEFWAPIREGKLGEVFKGAPRSIKEEGYLDKRVRGVQLTLQLNNHQCSIRLRFEGANRLERRDEVMELFPESEGYKCKYKEASQSVSVVFSILDKGKKDSEHWPEIREKLVTMGTDIYNKINESDL